jgi:hypothetical protein
MDGCDKSVAEHASAQPALSPLMARHTGPIFSTTWVAMLLAGAALMSTGERAIASWA